MQLDDNALGGIGGFIRAGRRALSGNNAESGGVCGKAGKPARKSRRFALLALLAAAALLPCGAAYGQLKGQAAAITPQWIDDGWRNAQYPASEWYVGYSVDAVKAGANLAEIQKRVEKEAQNKLAEGISVRIQATSATHTSSVRSTDGKNTSETVKKDYGQIIQASTDAEVAKVELTSFHDQANNKVHALAKVKKADLAAYYVSRVEFYLQKAENDFKLAQQHAASDRKRSALEQTDAAKKNIAECGKYNELLSAVDYKGDTVKRLLDKAAALLREIAAFETKLQESALVFIGGTEMIGGNQADIVVPRLQSKFSENGCRVVDKREDASYILTVDVKNGAMSKDANFYYCNATVRADLYNVKTGKSEAKLNFSAPKAGWTNESRACEKAFEEAANALWKQVREKTEVCK
jgi:hypothetical protein